MFARFETSPHESLVVMIYVVLCTYVVLKQNLCWHTGQSAPEVLSAVTPNLICLEATHRAVNKESNSGCACRIFVYVS
jgi:hypothetical protein